MSTSFSNRKSALQTLLVSLFAFLTAICATTATAQTFDMTMDVLVNSANTTGYSTVSGSPGEYQRYVERYLEHLQIPYRVIDTATQAPPAGLSSVQLIVSGHAGLSLSAAWQQAIAQAVAGGTGFVNFDSDPAIGTNAHMQQIFQATGSSAGAAVTAFSIPSAVIPGGSSPHYIAALQLRFPSTPAGDLQFQFHQNEAGITNTMTPTVLTGAIGTPIAMAGASPLILATTTSGGGRAVDFASYDFMRPDRFGFMMGVDDLVWRSMVWAARKPFVLRGYPHFFALQLDDEVADFPTRFTDLWNTSYTGTLNADGTGGPWKSTAMAQFVDLDAGGQDRTAAIAEVNSGNLKIAFHTQTGGSEGDLYWNLSSSSPLTDAQWQANLVIAKQVMQGNGGADILPKLSRSMNPHFWNLSNNVGYDMWNTFGTRYITEIQTPGAYFNQSPSKPDNQRIAGHPFRLYELPPSYGEPNEIWPLYMADDLVVGSTAGLPSQTFFTFATQLLGYTFPTFDAKWPSDSDGYSVAYSVDNFEEYAWRFWSGQAPTQVYSHDGGNYEKSTEPERQAAITGISNFLNAHGVRHLFMENLGDYMRARTKSVLTTAQATPSTLTLNFTGTAQDADGNNIPTYFYTYYGDNEGVLTQIPGFAGGYTFTTSNTAPTGISLSANKLAFASMPTGPQQTQQITIANSGSGSLVYTTSSDSAWLSVSPSNGTAPGTLNVTVNPTGLSAGTYNGNITVASAGAVNTPQVVPVSFTIAAPSIGLSPASLAFNGTYLASNPASQQINISNVGGGSLSWTASASVPWLALSASSGSAPFALSVSANIAGLTPGTYTGNISISSAGASNSPQTVPVTLTIVGLLMQPTFLSTTLDGWAYSPLGFATDWTSGNGILSNNGGGATQIYAGNANWTNYTVQTAFQLTSIADYPGGLRARISPATGAAYAVWLYPTEGVVKLLRTTAWSVDASGLQVLGTSTPVTFDTNWHTLAVTLNGSQITVTYDGANVLTATDTTLTSGWVGLDVSNRPISFRNFQVTASYVNTATLTAAPASLTYTTAAGSSPAAQSLAISTSDSSAAVVSLLPSTSWLSATPSSGTTPASSSIAVSSNTLTTGNYSGNVKLSSFGTTNTSVAVPVSLAVQIATQGIQQTVSPTTLSFAGTTGGTAAPTQAISIVTSPSNAAYTTSSDSAWLTATPTSGTTPGSIQVTANPATLAAGTYTGHITSTVSTAQNPTILVTVTFTVSAASSASLALTPATLTFVGAATANAPIQTVNLTSTPTTGVNWTSSHTSSWLTPSVASGTAPSNFQVGAASSGLALGSYTDTLSLKPASGTTLSVPVALRVGSLLFSDTFANNSNWKASTLGLQSNWSIVSNTYKYNGGGPTQQYAGSTAWTNYTLQADVNLGTASNYPGGIRFRVNTATGAGYALWLYPGSSSVILYKVPQWNIDQSNSTLASKTGVTLKAGLHHIRIDISGKTFTAFVDNVQVLTATDTTYTTGAIALDVSNQVVSFSNVSVIQ